MRYNLFQVQILSIVFLALGCATSSNKTNPTAVNDLRLEQKAKAYKVSIQGIGESQIKAEGCAKQSTQVRLKWDWRDAVKASNRCFRMRDLAQTEVLAQELATREPASPWGPFFLASVAKERGELERALWLSELALKRAPEVGLVHYLKGQILWSKKDYSVAVYSFERSVQLDESLLAAHLFLGRLYFREQSYNKASRHFYAVLKIEPRNPIALMGLAESQLQDKNVQGALEAYTRLADSYISDGQYLSRIGEIYENVLSDIPHALSTYRLLRDRIRMARVQKNIDPQLESKIRELENSQSGRSLASHDEKRK